MTSHQETSPEPSLQRTLGPLMLWALGVGYVISGEYFGWNYGLPVGGTYGMLAATLFITLMYVTFTLSYVELACAIPKAGGAFVYAQRALGPFPGFLAGIVQIIEFVFAPPAIAMAIGAYVAQRYTVDPRLTATACYFLFTAINVAGVRHAARLELFVTALAVGELLIFIAVVAPHFQLANITKNALPNGDWTGAFAAIPFAIWFYLAIEGVANAAEETKDPQRNVPIGFGSAIITLVVLALGVFFASIGVAGWEAVVYDPPGSTTMSDAPLPLALKHVVEQSSVLYTMLLAIGLFGLIASFHGIIFAAGRATMELGRAGFAPRALGAIHPRTHTPAIALLVNMLAGIVAIWSGRTPDIITLSVFGALALYIVSMIALFALRKKEPELERPFKATFYPVFPAIALVIAVVSMGAMIIYNTMIAGIFFAMIAGASLMYALLMKKPHRA